MKYKQYLQSPEWKTKRNIIREEYLKENSLYTDRLTGKDQQLQVYKKKQSQSSRLPADWRIKSAYAKYLS